jgi:murein L,D-transpeptidase YafK
MSVKSSSILILLMVGLLAAGNCLAQKDGADFRGIQLSSERVIKAWAKYNDTLSRKFAAKHLAWPPSDIYLRAFKLPNELELWARDNPNSEYQQVDIYRICAVSGALGPKRQKGDRQVPEGFYFIEEFNPKSDYHLSMLLNYPNYSDRQKGTSNPGGDIYIHGGCLTIGCLPMDDEGIREIYTLCLNAKLNGQEYIPVHIFPTRMSKPGVAYLRKETNATTATLQFWNSLRNGYDYFEEHHKLLPVMYTPDGQYSN